MTENRDSEKSQAIEDEIEELKRKLQDAETRLNAANGNISRAPPCAPLISNNGLSSTPMIFLSHELTSSSPFTKLFLALPPPPLRLRPPSRFLRLQQRPRVLPSAQPPPLLLHLPAPLPLLPRLHHPPLPPRRAPTPTRPPRPRRRPRRLHHLHRRPARLRRPGPRAPFDLGARIQFCHPGVRLGVGRDLASSEGLCDGAPGRGVECAGRADCVCAPRAVVRSHCESGRSGRAGDGVCVYVRPCEGVAVGGGEGECFWAVSGAEIAG